MCSSRIGVGKSDQPICAGWGFHRTGYDVGECGAATPGSTPRRRCRTAMNSAMRSALSRSPHFSLLLLFIVAIFNYTDRYVIAILLPDIKQDFQLSDTQMGFLTGVAFTSLYVLAGVPIARLADRFSRKKLL